MCFRAKIREIQDGSSIMQFGVFHETLYTQVSQVSARIPQLLPSYEDFSRYSQVKFGFEATSHINSPTDAPNMQIVLHLTAAEVVG